MSGAIPPHPQYAFMAWYSVKSAGTTLPLPFNFYSIARSGNGAAQGSYSEGINVIMM